MTEFEIAAISGAIYAVARSIEGGVQWVKSHVKKVEVSRQKDKEDAHIEALFYDINNDMKDLLHIVGDIKVAVAKLQEQVKN